MVVVRPLGCSCDSVEPCTADWSSGARPENTRSATPRIAASRFELPLLGSNQDSPDPESGVLPVTPRGRGLENSGLRFGRKVLHETSRSEEHTSELQSQSNLVCRLLLEKK